MTLQEDRRIVAERNIGKRCRWGDEPHLGTIVDVKVTGGWPMYVVEWDPGHPDWWGSRASASGLLLVIEEEAS